MSTPPGDPDDTDDELEQEPDEEENGEEEVDDDPRLGSGPIIAPGDGEVGLGFDEPEETDIGGIEYIDDADLADSEPSDMTIGNVHVRGTVEVEESGSGFTEEYKAQRERESGGQDDVDEPEAANLNVTAWGTEGDWEQLNLMRQQRDPFPVSIGPFVFEEMGITNVEQTIQGKYGPTPRLLNIELQEFRELIVQRQSLEEALGGGSATGSGTPGEVQGPQAGDVSYSGTPEVIPGGAHPVYNVGSGESWGGELLDMSSNGSGATIVGNGTGWVIENVGVEGVFNGRPLTNGDALINATTTGSAAVRHLFAGHGASNERDGCIYSGGNSGGELEVRRVNVQGWDDNGVYASLPNAPGNTEIVDCYAHNNQTSDYRLSNGLINNCVGVRDGRGGRGNRNIWAWSGGSVEVRDCDIQNSNGGDAINANSHGGNVNVTGSTQLMGAVNGNVSGSYGSNPDPTNYHPDIPGSAAEAAEGVGQT